MADAAIDEKEKRKAEVRARLEQAAASKKKKGFMTPARKKKLRTLLRKKAAEELKIEQERKAAERMKIIEERTGKPKNIEGCNEAELQSIVKEYFERFELLQSDKYDLEYEVMKREYEIRELSSKVSEQKGKFIIPPLKKVSKMAQQMEKIRMFTMKASKVDFSSSLKKVDKFKVEEEKKKEEEKEAPKPEWTK